MNQYIYPLKDQLNSIDKLISARSTFIKGEIQSQHETWFVMQHDTVGAWTQGPWL